MRGGKCVGPRQYHQFSTEAWGLVGILMGSTGDGGAG